MNAFLKPYSKSTLESWRLKLNKLKYTIKWYFNLKKIVNHLKYYNTTFEIV